MFIMDIITLICKNKMIEEVPKIKYSYIILVTDISVTFDLEQLLLRGIGAFFFAFNFYIKAMKLKPCLYMGYKLFYIFRDYWHIKICSEFSLI